MSHITDEKLAEIEAGLEGVTPGEWGVWREPTPTKADAIAELTEQVQLTETFAGAVYLINAGGKCPATTGCGPASAANAAHIARLNAPTVRALIARLKAAEAERDRLRDGAIEEQIKHGETAFELEVTKTSLAEALEGLREASGYADIMRAIIENRNGAYPTDREAWSALHGQAMNMLGWEVRTRSILARHEGKAE